jgi:hypothetical protein
VPVARQILPSLISAAQGGPSGSRLSVSITPEALGHVSITVDRAADGTTVIQVAAERLATMEMMRQDQADLVRALDQAGLAQHSHSLSFSWEGGGGGMAGWGGSNEPQGEHRPATAARGYADEQSASPVWAKTPQAGGVDLTA